MLKILDTLSRHFTTYKLPIEIRILQKNKKTIDIIRHLMENNRGSDLAHIIAVGNLVGLEENDVRYVFGINYAEHYRFNAADYVLHRRNDFNLSLSLVEELVEVNYAPAYRLCYKLASNDNARISLQKQLQLMLFTVTNCSASDLPEMIGFYRILEARQMAEKFGVSIKQPVSICACMITNFSIEISTTHVINYNLINTARITCTATFCTSFLLSF
jgi:hypothetical protein